MSISIVLILYNQPVLPAGHPDHESEHDVLNTVRDVRQHLENAFDVVVLGLANDPGPLLDQVRTRRPDVVFNLFEGLGDQGNTEAHVAGLLDWMKVPFTGSPFHTLSLARGKHLTKFLFRGAGIPTPDFFVVEERGEALLKENKLGWPVIVKPALQDASIGLDQGSVVTDMGSLDERVAYLLQQYGPPVIVEQFIRGRELNVGLIEDPDLRALPISEILFHYPEPACWPIVTYEAKWKPGSHDDVATRPKCPAEVDAELAEQLKTIARRAFQLLGCRDYARVDFRVDAAGRPYVLEVNPNPDYSAGAGLANALKSAGIGHEQFTVDLVRNALDRARDRRRSR